MNECKCIFPCGGTEDGCPSSPNYNTPTKPANNQVEYGWLVKCIETGEIDFDTRYPVCFDPTNNKRFALTAGYKWVKIKITYEEVSEDEA